MAKYKVAIDLCASVEIEIDAGSKEEAEEKARAEICDEDKFIAEHESEIWLWNPEIVDIEEDE